MTEFTVTALQACEWERNRAGGAAYISRPPRPHPIKSLAGLRVPVNSFLCPHISPYHARLLVNSSWILCVHVQLTTSSARAYINVRQRERVWQFLRQHTSARSADDRIVPACLCLAVLPPQPSVLPIQSAGPAPAATRIYRRLDSRDMITDGCICAFALPRRSSFHLPSSVGRAPSTSILASSSLGSRRLLQRHCLCNAASRLPPLSYIADWYGVSKRRRAHHITPARTHTPVCAHIPIAGR